MSQLNREFDQFARRAYGLSGVTLLRKTEKGESGGKGGAVSSAGARGWMQFMPTTRTAVIRYTKGKVDPWRSRGEALEAAKLHMLGKLGHKRGLGGYNPGGGKAYIRYILKQDVGGDNKPLPASKQSVRSVGSTPSRTTSKTTETTKTDTEGAILDSLIGGHKRKGSLFDDITRRVDSGSYTSTSSKTTKEPTKGSTPKVEETDVPKGGGNFKLAPNANRPGVNLAPAAQNFARQMAGIAGSFTIGTGSRHSKMTTSGNVSDHWDGHGFDIPTSGKAGDRIAYAAFRSAGVNEKQARLWSKNGGLYNIKKGGKRYQIIWKTNEGGNHYNHVHVGIR